MSVAKVIELTSTSTTSFEDAIKRGVAKASKTLRNVQGAWIKEQQVSIEDGEIVGYRVNMLLTFVLKEDDDDGEQANVEQLQWGSGSRG
jgi:flavin-binding protein dodecin